MSTDTTQFDAETNVIGHVTAPRCRLGTDTCNFEIEYPNGNTTNPEMYVTLPNTYKGKLVTQKYRMRSIIEAIQEINRRTATFNCNTSFEYAKDAFDVNTEDPYNQFACNDHEDGLPAASNGSINDLTDAFKIQIIQDGEVIADTEENTYPLKDILQWDTFIASNTDFVAFLSENGITAVGLSCPTMNDVDPVGEVVTIAYTPPPH
jgi:hypothetical protein